MIKWFRKKRNEGGSQEKVDLRRVDGSSNHEEPPLGEESPEEENESGECTTVAEGGDLSDRETSQAEGTAVSAHENDDEMRGGFFKRLRRQLRKTRQRLTDRVDRLVLGKKVIDEDLLEELEEILITSDLGVRTTQVLLERVAGEVKRKELQDPSRLVGQLRCHIQELLSVDAHAVDPRAAKPYVIMVVGVNGVGKTTTIGKLAHMWRKEGLSCLLVAADTFRAAAIEQLVLWGERAQVEVIRQKSGADPSAVAFDGVAAALSRGTDVVIVDTAGRMHTQINLMEEIKKVHRVIKKKLPTAPHETWLVLDATTGQNAISQVRMFQEALNLTGFILTKLDGTAKGGVIVPICHEFQIPVRYIGIGEGMDDLRPFDAEVFAKALF